MIVLLCGEGPTDVGKDEYNPFTAQYEWKNGTIPIFIQRILGTLDAKNVEFRCVTDKMLLKLQRKKEGKQHSAGQRRRRKEGFPSDGKPSQPNYGHAQTAAALLEYADSNGITYDIVGMYKDTDRETGKKNTVIEARKKHDEVVKQIHEGFLDKENAFAAVPIRILENWLIADENALKGLKERGGNDKNIKSISNPEELWGSHNDRTSNYPKYYLERILRQLNVPEENNTDAFCSIAESADLEVLKNKCGSFSMFCEELTVAYWNAYQSDDT